MSDDREMPPQASLDASQCIRNTTVDIVIHNLDANITPLLMSHPNSMWWWPCMHVQSTKLLLGYMDSFIRPLRAGWFRQHRLNALFSL